MSKTAINPYSEENLKQLNTLLGTSINFDLLKIAITTRSARNENKKDAKEDNGKLELLGDCVLKLIITESLYEKEENEEALTIKKGKLENNSALAGVAKGLNIKQHLFLGGSEMGSAGKGEESLLANSLEALIGAVYWGQGFEESKSFIGKKVLALLLQEANSGELKDPVTRFYELYKERFRVEPEFQYECVSGAGTHEQVWDADVSINGEVVWGR